MKILSKEMDFLRSTTCSKLQKVRNKKGNYAFKKFNFSV